MPNFWPKCKAKGLQFHPRIHNPKMPDFWPTSKVIGLQFYQKIIKNKKKCLIFGQNARIKVCNFIQKFIVHKKILDFSQESKVIGLQFNPKIHGKKSVQFLAKMQG